MRMLEWDVDKPKGPLADGVALKDACCEAVRPVVEGLRRQGVEEDTLEWVEVLCVGRLVAGICLDIRVDVFERGELLIPDETAKRHGLDRALTIKAVQLDRDRGGDGSGRDAYCDCGDTPNSAMRVVLPAFKQALEEQCLFAQGSLIMGGKMCQGRADTMPADTAKGLQAIYKEGLAVVKLIKKSRYDTLTRRPEMERLAKWWLGMRSGS